VALNVQLSSDAKKYIAGLDKPTRERMIDKLERISADPINPALSLPLKGDPGKRYTRVGKYRLLLYITAEVLLVTHAGSRGQIYREASG
jgi:mRNA-degrading endonuclease RelE of RelBE toxin-antitoxin system